MDRKDFFFTAFRLLLSKSSDTFLNNPVINALEKLADTTPLSDVNPSIRKQRPPGAALTEVEFKAKCTGCDRCMAACPFNIVMIEDLDKRHPLIYPEKDPCLQCEGYPCIQACPTEALDLKNGTTLRPF